MNVNQGTVTPTHFVVVHESQGDAAEAGMKPSTLQRLSYALTHMYFNWPGNVKVPAPCQYAHKLAFMVSPFYFRKLQDYVLLLDFRGLNAPILNCQNRILAYCRPG